MLPPASGQVVYPEHFIAALEQHFDDVRPDLATGAGDQNLHSNPMKIKEILTDRRKPSAAGCALGYAEAGAGVERAILAQQAAEGHASAREQPQDEAA
jgi:hypothetical protein